MAPKVTVKNGRLSTRLSNLSDTNLLLAITIAVFLLMYALARFDENTRHMIIFHVLTHDSPVGDKGDKMRLYLSDKGYQKALENAQSGNIRILSHAKLVQGNLRYDRKDQIR